VNRAITPPEEGDYCDLPTCPYCGAQFVDAFEMGFDGDESHVEIECDGTTPDGKLCGMTFECYMHVSVDYSSFKVGESND
jgi:hypothetical protein